MPQIQTKELLYFYLQRNANVQQHATYIRVTYLYKSELAVKDFSLSISFNIFLHVNVMN